MGCTSSKPTLDDPPQTQARAPTPQIKPYKGPSEFRASAMRTTYQPYRPPQDIPPCLRPGHQGAQMYEPYRAQDEEQSIRERRRYSWEGYPSEKVLLTYEQMVERGIIAKDALKRK